MPSKISDLALSTPSRLPRNSRWASPITLNTATVGRTMLQLYKPTGGEIWFDGEIIDTKEKLRAFRRRAQMVFQDPYSSLNPRMTVADIVAEPIDVHHLCAGKKEREERIRELMRLVGLNTEHATRYAHEFSGGQRQRIGRWLPSRNSLCATSLSPPWTSLFRRRLSTCWRICSISWG